MSDLGTGSWRAARAGGLRNTPRHQGAYASKSNAPVFISPTVRSFFVPDPQGFWLEFKDRDVKKEPTAHTSSPRTTS